MKQEELPGRREGGREREMRKRAWGDGDSDGERKDEEEVERKAGGNDIMLAVLRQRREREGGREEGREGGQRHGAGTGCKGGSHYFYLPTI